jgi:hypothetical protein
MDKEKKLKKFGILLISMVILTTNVFASEWWKESNENVETVKTTTFDRLVELKSSTNSNTVIDANYYIVEFEIKQSHFTLNISEHLKDSINKLTFEVPVDKDYYNKVRVGQEITDSFRMGSFVMKGSIGKWKITVKSKYIKQK